MKGAYTISISIDKIKLYVMTTKKNETHREVDRESRSKGTPIATFNLPLLSDMEYGIWNM